VKGWGGGGGKKRAIPIRGGEKMTEGVGGPLTEEKGKKKKGRGRGEGAFPWREGSVNRGKGDLNSKLTLPKGKKGHTPVAERIRSNGEGRGKNTREAKKKNQLL